MCKGILTFCLRGLLGKNQRSTLFELLDCLTLICDESQDSANSSLLIDRVNVALARMEMDFPMTIQVNHYIHDNCNYRNYPYIIMLSVRFVSYNYYIFWHA